jgi:hypothetical protein
MITLQSLTKGVSILSIRSLMKPSAMFIKEAGISSTILKLIIPTNPTNPTIILNYIRYPLLTITKIKE